MSNDFDLVFNRAVMILAVREHSSKELADKLLSKGFEKPTINKVILELKQQNLQNDERFVESFFKTWANKGRGDVRIRQDLIKHNINKDLIENAFSQEEFNWQEILEKVWQKKFKNPPKTIKEKSTQFSFLQNRGFAVDDINKLLNTEFDEV